MPDISSSLETIDEAIDTYRATKVFALFSGGDDSLAALRVAMEHPKFTAAVHCNTGVGVEATREFVHQTCSDLKCPLIEYCAAENVNAKGQPDPQVYEQLVLEQGFPGPTKFGHGKMYSRLKERGLERLFREHVGKNEKAVLASGCRSEESTRRMGTTTRISQGQPQKNGNVKNKRWIWVNHIHDWTKQDTLSYRQSKNMPRNPVAELICKSGECLCGGFGNDGELEELTLYDLTRPTGLWLLDLQKRVIEAGFPWKWHERMPKWFQDSRKGQKMMFDMSKYEVGPMCQSCEKRAEELITET